VNLEARSVRM